MTLFYVLIAARLDALMGTDYLRDAVCIGFIANEALSIIENAGLMGLPLQERLKKSIDVLKAKTDSSIELDRGEIPQQSHHNKKKEGKDTMKINTDYLSNKNSYEGQTPRYIVIHNTDNDNPGADARAHAKAQHDGNFDGMSAHVYVDDKEAYQALPFSRGAWHVGVDYGGKLFGTVNNRNSIGIEMCVQKGYDYEKAFQNTAEVCRQIMKKLSIPKERVVQHYDVCAKDCPSAIRARGDWERFKNMIRGENTGEEEPREQKAGLTEEVTVRFPEISRGCTGVAVRMLQAMLGVSVDGIFGEETEASFCVFQKNTGQAQDGICGKNGWKAAVEHMKANTFKQKK